MSPRATILALTLAAATSCGPAPRSPTPVPAPAPRTYVLVHGAWGGGWAFRRLDSLLTAAGHVVHRPTLTGLGERAHLARPDVNLTTHVTDVVNLLLFEDLRDVVLVGHSYGGMVISGVAERAPERIRHLVFIDAFVPEDGESVATARGGRSTGLVDRMLAEAKDGMLVPAWVKPETPLPHDVPQPAATFTEPLALRSPAARRIPGTYILTVEPAAPEADDPFAPFSRRAKARGWRHHILAADHIPERSAPHPLAALLLGVP
ncbi:MAG TPA: alpha/beta hydrolase [Gemmatimonadaceae bacterium]|nr:alpha/beta hydrolase [Gemmatimonadaceae bacterium]